MITPESVDTAATALVESVMFNIIVAPMFWLSLPLILHPFLPPSSVLVWAVCSLSALLCIGRYFAQRSQSCITDWSSEIVVVTGGSRGIGAMVAEILAKVKHVKAVIILDLLAPTTQSDNIHYYQCDVSDIQAVRKTTQLIVKEIGHPTALINNAGIVAGKTMLDLSTDQIDRHITVASVMGLVGASQMSKSINVHVTCVYPGLTLTGMFDGVQHKLTWITPHLSVQRVAQAIVDALESGRNCDIKLPLYTNLVLLLRLLPIEISDIVRNATGANDDMKSFKGSISSRDHPSKL
ncbi:hypothetical protein BSLG_001347 [Batrachochytrium salamandrivorans]|nr:hypothetical protein BSLG_001347 [Batrachochytrium salamandrivorans]